ncbi:MAG: type I-PGING CRISPR-associated protein Cas5p [Prevotellaceae bacterium]|jgi:CRISPR-associated protein Cas5|nr:type I-PGING CRISPR-associated protein Cas5p [Prevotellaceae bacterium]
MNNSDTNSNRISEKKEIDISILWGKPMLNSTVILEIQPLAPLSMVSELPGSYYKTLKMPDKKMLCGLFENILGWHIALMDRKQIFEELKKVRKKQTAKTFVDSTKGSTYFPLLMEYFEIQECVPKFKRVIFYDDLWKKAFRRSDAVVHPKGTANLSFELISQKRELPRNEKNPKQIDDKELEKFFKNNTDKFPQYYTSPTKREYLYMEGSYSVRITIDMDLYKMLQSRLADENIGYLGNSEGWVDLNFKLL